MSHLVQRSMLVLLLVAMAPLADAMSAIPEVRSAGEIAGHFARNAPVRVLNLWATWCAPCVAEMPALQSIHADYRRRGVSLIAVSMDDMLPGGRDEARARVSSFIAEKAITFPSLLYVGKLPSIEEELRLSGEIPVTIVFDAKGRELARVEGILDEAKFRAELDRILSSKASSTR